MLGGVAVVQPMFPAAYHGRVVQAIKLVKRASIRVPAGANGGLYSEVADLAGGAASRFKIMTAELRASYL